MEERKLNERESLEIITSMIARTKVRYLGSGNILLVWGYLVAVVAICVWILITATHKSAWNWLWFAIPAIGFPVTFLMARKENLKSGVTTYSDKITSNLWTIFGISEIVVAFICLGFELIGDINCWRAMLVYSLLLAPGAEIAQGFILKEKSLVGGGIVGLAAGIVTVCCVAGGIPLLANWYMPLFIIAFVAMMIVPGHILNDKAKRQ